MAALTGNKIKDSYLGLLKTTDSGIFTSSLIRITDGGGNGSQLYLSNTAIRFHNAYTFPNADGTSGQVLSTDGSGTLYFTESSDNQTLEEVLTQGNTTTIAISSSADITTTAQFNGDINGALLQKVKAAEVLSKGDVVYISGGTGDNPEVSKANASDSTKMPALGIMKESLNNINDEGECITSGELTGLNLTGFSTGDELFVSSATAGGLVDTAPTGEANLIQKIGKVIKGGNGGALTVLGAFRVNALPNLPTGVILGNGTSVVSASSNLLIASDGTITLYQPNNVPTDKKNYNIGGGNIALNTDGFNTGFGEGNLSQVGFVGSNNSAFGYQSSFSMTTGDNNTSVGFHSLLSETVGADNTAIGHYSLFNSNNGNYNTAIGSYSLYTNSSGGQNVALGYEALRNNTTSSHNAALGYRALKLSTGDHNLGVGYNSGNAIVTGNNNVVIGSNTGSTIDGLSNRIIISDGAANIRQLIDNVGKLQMPDYGSGTHTGTLAKTLAVDSSGYVIEVDATTGTVTSVALSVPTGLTVTNSPITTSGTITIGGTLGVANGGTGATTLTGILLGNGTSAISAVTDGTTSGQVLSTDGSGTYSFIDAATSGISGSGADDQIAVFDGSNSVSSSSSFQYDGRILTLQDGVTGDKNIVIGNASTFPTSNSSTANVIIGNNAFNDVSQFHTGGGNVIIGQNAAEDGTKLSNNIIIGKNAGSSLGNVAASTQSLNVFIGNYAGSEITATEGNVILGGFDGDDGTINITTDNNNVVLSTGLGVVRAWFNSTGTLRLSAYNASNKTGTVTYLLGTDNSGNVLKTTAGTGTVAGTGTAGTITKWATGGADIEDSIITESASAITVSGNNSSDLRVNIDNLTDGYASKLSLYAANDAGARFNYLSSGVKGATAMWRIDGGGVNNNLVMYTGGSEAVRISSGGDATFSENVIINTENSGIIVDLASRHGLMKYANYGAGLVGKDTGTDGNISTWLGRFNGTITSPTAVYQDLVISNSGKVGIGTGSTAPSEKLDVYGNIKIGTTANSNFLNRSDSHWIQYNGGATTNDTYMRVYGVSHASAAKTIGFYTNNIPRLTISSTGNATFSGALSGTSINATSFNAGTGVFNFSSGDALLDYSSGAVRLRTYKTAVGYITPLTIDSQTGAATFSSTVTAASSITINGSSNGTIYFQDVPNGASMFYIQSAAYIGTAPYNDNRIIAANSSNITLEAGGSVRLKIEAGGTVLPGADNAQNLGASGTRWSLIYSANGVSTSDETLKENIIECDLGIDFVMTLKPKSYNFKDLSETHQDFNKKHYGLIAQDLKDGLLKDSVDGNKDGEYGLMYNDLIAPMIKAIQEQQTIIEDLKSRIETLEG